MSRSVTHTKERKDQWWRLDLGKTYAINMIVVYNRNDCCQERINGAKVYAGEKLCGQISYIRDVNSYWMSCGGASASSIKIIQENDHLSLAEVNVFGGSKAIKGLSLLSQKRPTSQSSLHAGGHASRAVDGRTDGHWNRGTITHTGKDPSAWWQVDLQGKYPVHLVVVHNRWDCCGERIDGAVVKVDKTTCGTVRYLPGMNVYPVNCKGATGTIVRIELKNEYLSLAEVQVFGTGGPPPRGANIGTGDYAQILSIYKASSMSKHHGKHVSSIAVDGITDERER